MPEVPHNHPLIFSITFVGLRIKEKSHMHVDTTQNLKFEESRFPQDHPKIKQIYLLSPFFILIQVESDECRVNICQKTVSQGPVRLSSCIRNISRYLCIYIYTSIQSIIYQEVIYMEREKGEQERDKKILPLNLYVGNSMS